jgi:hypothetical protein
MEVSGSLLYWITRMDYIHTSFTVVAACAIPTALLLSVGLALDAGIEPKDVKVLRRVWCGLVFLCVLSTAGHILVPTTNEAVIIYVVPELAKSDVALKTMPKLRELADVWLDAQIRTLKKEVETPVEKPKP